MDPRATAVLNYWICEGYADLPSDYVDQTWFPKWFGGGAEQDKEIKEKFGADVEDVRADKLSEWKNSTYECLAGIILMDQFTRNMYRDTKDMYCLDEQAREWASHLKAQPEYESMHPACCFFVMLPFMHGETVAEQEICLDMITELVEKLKTKHGEEAPIVKMFGGVPHFAMEHKVIIDKWGRFPHRNGILGRESTPEEAAGLADGSIKGF